MGGFDFRVCLCLSLLLSEEDSVSRVVLCSLEYSRTFFGPDRIDLS